MENMAMMRRKVPSLLELSIQTAIDNIRYISDVGELDIYLLKDILPHCTVDQLMHIENSSVGRDLSPVTDDLWKRFYEMQFGAENANVVIKRMKQKQVVFKWKQLYEAKTKETEKFQSRLGEKIKQRYQEELARKQSRQTQFCRKQPPTSIKRSFSAGSGSYNVSNLKSNIMKKAKIECLKSHEARIHATIRKNDLLRKSCPPQSISRSTTPSNFLNRGSASSSKIAKPRGRN